MRRAAAGALLAVAMGIAGLGQAFAQGGGGGGGGTQTSTPPVTRGTFTPLAAYTMGATFCAAASPIAGTIILQRELTASEVGRSTLGCFLGPVGWILGPVLFPDLTPPGAPSTGPAQSRRGGFRVPPPGEARFVPDEVLVDIDSRVSPQYIANLAQRLQITLLETQTFALTGRTLQRWRIDGGRSPASIIRALSRFARVFGAQTNNLFEMSQAQPQATAQAANPAQYVVSKLRLVEVHRITGGDNVTVAVIDSAIDERHPDLAGVVVARFNAIGTFSTPHAHGTGMAGAIASHVKLIGVAPKVRLLAVRAFDENARGADGTTFNILKGLDWAAGQNARIVNMSFAGPTDGMLRQMLARANARGMVLIAAVGNAGPRSPPLYPAADPNVIGVTATDAEDKLLQQANRGPQIAVAAPGVDILVPAPNEAYQVTSGTSVAAAHVSGVAALLLARNAKLRSSDVRRLLIATARPLGGTRRNNDFGAGLVDALRAVTAAGPN